MCEKKNAKAHYLIYVEDDVFSRFSIASQGTHRLAAFSILM